MHLAGVAIRKAYTAILTNYPGVPYAYFHCMVSSNNSLAFVLAGICAGIIFLLVQAHRIKNREA